MLFRQERQLPDMTGIANPWDSACFQRSFRRTENRQKPQHTGTNGTQKSGTRQEEKKTLNIRNARSSFFLRNFAL